MRTVLVLVMILPLFALGGCITTTASKPVQVTDNLWLQAYVTRTREPIIGPNTDTVTQGLGYNLDPETGLYERFLDPTTNFASNPGLGPAALGAAGQAARGALTRPSKINQSGGGAVSSSAANLHAQLKAIAEAAAAAAAAAEQH